MAAMMCEMGADGRSSVGADKIQEKIKPAPMMSQWIVEGMWRESSL